MWFILWNYAGKHPNAMLEREKWREGEERQKRRYNIMSLGLMEATCTLGIIIMEKGKLILNLIKDRGRQAEGYILKFEYKKIRP